MVLPPAHLLAAQLAISFLVVFATGYMSLYKASLYKLLCEVNSAASNMKKMKISSSTTVAIVFFAALAYASLVDARPEPDLISRVEVHDLDYVAERMGLVTCNPGRPKYTFPAPELAIEKNYMQLWRHGGDWKAEPNKTMLVNCHGGGGVWFLNTTPNEIILQYARIGSMARDVLLMCTKRVRRGRFEVNGESVSKSGFVIIVAGALCPAGGNS